MNTIHSHTLHQLRLQQPLILCLTNYVTMQFTANCLLSLGAAPLMSESVEEIEELVSISHALYINIGTLNETFVHLTRTAIKHAQSLNIPIVLDPVGAGASNLRTSIAKEFASYAHVIRGNASEIMALCGEDCAPCGTESRHLVSDAQSLAVTLAKSLSAIVIISGKQDFITDGQEAFYQNDGNEIMSQITGMGCSLTAVIAAFCASNSAYYQASTEAISTFNKAGSDAAINSNGPGSFKSQFIDALYNSK